jgi:FtsZ-interacting cell division protein ZipA
MTIFVASIAIAIVALLFATTWTRDDAEKLRRDLTRLRRHRKSSAP